MMIYVPKNMIMRCNSSITVDPWNQVAQVSKMQPALRRRKLVVTYGQQRQSYAPSVFESPVTVEKGLAVILQDFNLHNSSVIPRFSYGEDQLSLSYALTYCLLGQDPDGTFDPSQGFVELRLTLPQPTVVAPPAAAAALQRRTAATATIAAAAPQAQVLADQLQEGAAEDGEELIGFQEGHKQKKRRNHRKLQKASSDLLRQIVVCMAPLVAIAPQWTDSDRKEHVLPFPAGVTEVLVPLPATKWKAHSGIVEIMMSMGVQALILNNDGQHIGGVEHDIKQ
jgi:hypothetical protein